MISALRCDSLEPAGTGISIQHSQPFIDDLDASAIAECVRSRQVAQGEVARRFARELEMMHAASGVALSSSGSAGVSIALRALAVGVGDEVVLPGYVCASVRDAVLLTGATPVFCDIGSSWNATRETIDRVLTTRTRAIISVSMFGIAADVDGIADLGVPVIDDRCQAFGLPSSQAAKAAFSVCSFHAIKCLAAGEGGAVLAWTGDRAAALRDEGSRVRRTLGVFSDMQATLALRQLHRWTGMLERRRLIAGRYLSMLPGERVQRIDAASRASTVWYRFPVLLDASENFDDCRRRFAERGVQVRRGVDALLHREAGLPDSLFPESVATFDRTLSLPIWPSMTDSEVSHVLEVANDVLG